MKTWLKIFFARDKILHFSAGANVAYTVGIWFGPEWGLGAGIVAGAGKEAFDKLLGGTPEYLDFFMTAVGSLTAAIILTEAI